MEEYIGGINMFDSVQQEAINIKYDKRLSNFIIAYYFVQALNLFIKLVIGDFGAWNIISRGGLAFLLFLSLRPILKRNFSGAVAAELSLAICFGFTLLSRGANYSTYGAIMINALSVFMPMGIALTCIQDKRILLRKMYFFSWPIQGTLIIVLLNISGSQYSMPGGYALVFQLLIVMDHFFQTRKWYDLAAMIVDFFVIFLFGSRGPIVCVMAMLLLRLIFSRRISRMKRIVIAAAIVVAALILYLNYRSVLNILIQITRMFGYSSRNLRILAMGQLTDDSGRESIHNMYFRIIKDRPALGYGLVGGWKNTGMYPHHIYIELLLSFGVLFGPIACALVTTLAVKSVMNKNEYEQRIAHILLSYCVSLFLSHSFMMCPMFFLLMGLGISQSKIRLKFGHH